MSISSTHPRYDELADLYTQMKDTFEGQRKVKQQRATYLPPTRAMLAGGFNEGRDPGQRSYNDYIARASYYNAVAQTINTHMGTLHQQPATIILPPQIEPLIFNATLNNEELQEVLQQINRSQFIYGRCLVLLDFRSDEAGTMNPYLSIYEAPSITNWSAKGQFQQDDDFIVLREDYYRVLDFQYTSQIRYRVLRMINGQYHVGLFEENEMYDESRMEPQTIMGRPMREIPAVFINTDDLKRDAPYPPLLDISDTSIRLYQQLADYNIKSHKVITSILTLSSGTTGAIDDDLIITDDTYLKIPGDGSAVFISPSHEGLRELERGISMTAQRISHLSGQLISNQIGNRESEGALETRINNSNSTIVTITLTGGLGLSELLKIYGRALNIPDEVLNDKNQFCIKPNTDFSKRQINAERLRVLIELQRAGLITKEIVFSEYKEMSGTELDYSDIVDVVRQEQEQRQQNQPEFGLNN